MHGNHVQNTDVLYLFYMLFGFSFMSDNRASEAKFKKVKKDINELSNRLRAELILLGRYLHFHWTLMDTCLTERGLIRS